MSAYVLVFGRRQHGTLRKLNWPASKKRQGTKSREVGRRLSRERYGDLMLAQGSMMGGMLTGFDLRVCMYGR